MGGINGCLARLATAIGIALTFACTTPHPLVQAPERVIRGA